MPEEKNASSRAAPMPALHDRHVARPCTHAPPVARVAPAALHCRTPEPAPARAIGHPPDVDSEAWPWLSAGPTLIFAPTGFGLDPAALQPPVVLNIDCFIAKTADAFANTQPGADLQQFTTLIDTHSSDIASTLNWADHGDELNCVSPLSQWHTQGVR